MAKKNNYKTLRQRIASDLEMAANSTACILPTAYSQLYEAANQIRKGEVDDVWEYSFTELELPIQKPRHLSPNNIKVLHLFLDVKVKGNLDKYDGCTDGDPLMELNYRVRVVGESNNKNEKFTLGFHIDRVGDQDDSLEIHPLYHIHYFNESQSMDAGFVTLDMDAPRLVHHPVEAIIGILLAMANYNPDLYEKLRDNAIYMNLCNYYFDRIVKPYFESLSRAWGLKIDSIVDANPEICPYKS